MLIEKFLAHELTIKKRGEEQEEKEEKKKSITLKASQNDSKIENNEGSSDNGDEVEMLT